MAWRMAERTVKLGGEKNGDTDFVPSAVFSPHRCLPPLMCPCGLFAVTPQHRLRLRIRQCGRIHLLLAERRRCPRTHPGLRRGGRRPAGRRGGRGGRPSRQPGSKGRASVQWIGHPRDPEDKLTLRQESFEVLLSRRLWHEHATAGAVGGKATRSAIEELASRPTAGGAKALRVAGVSSGFAASAGACAAKDSACKTSS